MYGLVILFLTQGMVTLTGGFRHNNTKAPARPSAFLSTLGHEDAFTEQVPSIFYLVLRDKPIGPIAR